MGLDVFISTVPGDIHAAYVSVALAKHGYTAARWYPPAYRLQDEISFSTSAERYPKMTLALSGGREISLPEDSIGVFWYRRQGVPTLPKDLHTSDRSVAFDGCCRAMDSTLEYVGRNAHWSVNKFSAAVRAERSKMWQLETAHACGFRCPATLMSNSRAKIMEFIKEHKDVIFKPLVCVSWENDEGIATSFTARVSIEDLPAGDVLRSSPGLFQERIQKQYEVRVTVMGRYVVAVLLDSQRIDACRTDWRVFGPCVPLEQMTLPEEISSRCIEVTKRLGLVFGCIDLILTPSGEYIFLEINQQGQFLWLGERIPSLGILDTFAQFLGSGEPDFRGPSQKQLVTCADVYEEANALIQDDLQAFPQPLEVKTGTLLESGV